MRFPLASLAVLAAADRLLAIDGAVDVDDRFGKRGDAVDRDGLDALSIARLRGHDETARQLEAHANGRAGSRPDIH